MLIVAATEFELAAVSGVATACCGIGPVEAALVTAAELARGRHRGVLNIGIAGARALPVGTIVVGSESIYCDLVDEASRLPRVDRLAADAGLLDTAGRALPEAHVLPIGTTARVGAAATACEVEAMEGFGVLRAAAAAGIPALELRAISNRFDDARSAWRIEEALAALATAVPTLIEAIDDP